MNSVINQSVLTDLPNFYNEFEEKINKLINQLNANGKKVSEKSKENINKFLNELKRKEQQLETLSLSLNSISLDKNFTNRIITMDDVMRYADNLKGHQLKGYDIVESLKKYVIDSEKKLEPLTTESLSTAKELNIEVDSVVKASTSSKPILKSGPTSYSVKERIEVHEEEEKVQELIPTDLLESADFKPEIESYTKDKDDVEATILATPESDLKKVNEINILDELLSFLNDVKEINDIEEVRKILKGDEGEEKSDDEIVQKILKLLMNFNSLNKNDKKDIDLSKFINQVKKLFLFFFNASNEVNENDINLSN